MSNLSFDHVCLLFTAGLRFHWRRSGKSTYTDYTVFLLLVVVFWVFFFVFSVVDGL